MATVLGSPNDDLIRVGIPAPGVSGVPTSGADWIFGDAGDDVIFAGSGDDTLDGGLGSDDLNGGWGDDLYLVGDSFDAIVELEGRGHDRVVSQVSYALDDNVEDLELAPGSGAIAGTGNALDNVIVGNERANALLGFAGNDIIRGGLGDDIITGGDGQDTLHGDEGADRLVGDEGNDSLFGGAGDDVIYGGEVGKFSAIVSALTTTGSMEAWLADPGLSYVEAYVRFAPDLPADVVFGIDQEFFEGVDDPIRFAGADWMGLTGVSRDGRLWVDIGTPEELAGTPNDMPSWLVIDLGTPLQPDAWYRLHSVVDFASLEYVSFTIEGPGIDMTVDLRGLDLSYPNQIMSEGRALTTYVWTLSVGDVGDSNGGVPVVYFDDVSAGIVYEGQLELNLASGFEDHARFPEQPTTYPAIALSGYEEGRWYLERGGSVAWVESSANARSGSAVAALLAVDSQPYPNATDDDYLDGGDGNDSLFGNGGNDTLVGGPGADTLDGGAGADVLIGGDGNDRYIVTDALDDIQEAVGGGNDEVLASLIFTLPDNVEVLTLMPGAGAIDGTGNGLDNVIAGNEAANVLRGGAGNDTLDGGAGDDSLFGDAGNDVLTGGTGTDTLFGGDDDDTLNGGAGDDVLAGDAGTDILDGDEGNDRLDGGAGDDVLDGGLGVDTLIGGAGSDLYFVDETGDVIGEAAGEGNDQVFATATFVLPDHVEIMTLLAGAGAIDGTGNGLDNVLAGNEAANVLRGGAGNDTLDGGAGDDSLFGDAGNDVLVGSAGTDTLFGGDDDDTLIGGSDDDRLDGGAGHDTLLGEDGRDRLDGGAGDDVLDGGSGSDTLIGGAGNDIYIVDDTADVLVEAAGSGDDQVFATVSFVLPGHVEIMTLVPGAGAIDGTGNGLDNVIAGNESPNVLRGGAGDDVLIGGAGRDTIEGGEGIDLLTGNAWFGVGHDGETDIFLYAEVPASLDIDGVDFDPASPAAGGDLFDFSALFAALPTAQLIAVPDGAGNSWIGVADAGGFVVLALALGVADPSLVADDNILT